MQLKLEPVSTSVLIVFPKIKTSIKLPCSGVVAKITGTGLFSFPDLWILNFLVLCLDKYDSNGLDVLIFSDNSVLFIFVFTRLGLQLLCFFQYLKVTNL